MKHKRVRFSAVVEHLHIVMSTKMDAIARAGVAPDHYEIIERLGRVDFAEPTTSCP